MEGAQIDTPTRRGRPRQPDVEDRVFDGAMRVYAEHGWAGFTFEAVARETGVGKPALYRRWSARGELLAQAFSARWFDVEQIDFGAIRADLLALARMILQHMTSAYGRATIHMMTDLPKYAEVAESTAAYRDGVTAAARQIVHRAVDREEFPAGTSAALVLDIVVGASLNHVTSAPPELMPRLIAGLDGFAESLVDCVVRGLGGPTL